MKPTVAFKAATALPFLTGVDAFWRLNCAVIQTGRVDPVVNPGTYAEHAHSIVGGSNIGVNSTFDNLVDSPCSSCQVQADKSAYWTPLLYYQYPNGTFYEVPHGGSVVYYLGRGDRKDTVPFPKGFMMLSGNRASRSYDNRTMTWGNASYPGRPVADRASFACLKAGVSGPETPGLVEPTLCVNGMRAQIAFQACWNGVDLYKTDNSHVAYLSGIDNGICPPTHPVYLPVLFLETNYATSQVPNHMDGTPPQDDRYVFSNGDPTGFGFHGDFFNGWEHDVQIKAIEDCLFDNPYGVVDDCPILAASNTNGFPWNCPEQTPQIEEEVHGLLDQLPGCIDITYGPEAAPPRLMQCGPEDPPQPPIRATPMMTARATASPTAGASFGISQDQKYLGCYNDTQGSGPYRTLNAISISNYSVMTVEWCQAWCAERGYRLSGLQYAQECHCDNYINPTAVNAQTSNQTVNSCTWTCGGTMTRQFDGTQQLCGGLGYIDVYNNTDPSFDAFGDNSESAGNAQGYVPLGGYGPGYMGCWTDNRGGRALTGDFLQANNMTRERCADFCASRNGGVGYQLYGLQYFSQCFCGNAVLGTNFLLTPETSPTNSTCANRCSGNTSEICGGPNALSLYNNTDHVPPTAKPRIGKYETQQCLRSSPGGSGRGLQGNFTSRPDMTVDYCVKFCLGTYYHYAGVEYGIECYCGNEIDPQSGATIGPCDPNTAILCPGNQRQFCGGPNTMNLYYSETL